MKPDGYAYAVAYIRAIENNLLTKNDLEALLSAKTPDDAIRILVDKGYGNEYVSPALFETLLSAEMEKCWETVKGVLSDGEELNILLYKNDFHNLKAIVKSLGNKYDKVKEYFLYPTVSDAEDMFARIEKRDFSAMEEPFRSLAEECCDIMARSADGQLIDTKIDKVAMDYVYKKACLTQNSFLTGLVKLENLIKDIKIAYRCALTGKNAEFTKNALSEATELNVDKVVKAVLSGKDALLEYIEADFSEYSSYLGNSISEFEKYADKKIADYMKNSRFITLGIEPVVSYIYAKQRDIQSVRIIMSAKINNMDEEKIRGVLRSDAYVG